MFLIKFLLFIFMLIIAIGLFSMLTLVGAFRDIFGISRRTNYRQSGNTYKKNEQQTTTSQQKQKNKIFQKDEGEYVDYTEV